MRLEIVNAADRNSLNLYKNAQFSFSRIKQMEMPKLKATGRSRQKKNQPTVFTSEVKQKTLSYAYKK